MSVSKAVDRRAAMVSVRYADDELERIRDAAERQGSSISAFIRRASLGGQGAVIHFTVQPGTCNFAASPQSGSTLTLVGAVPVINV